MLQKYYFASYQVSNTHRLTGRSWYTFAIMRTPRQWLRGTVRTTWLCRYFWHQKYIYYIFDVTSISSCIGAVFVYSKLHLRTSGRYVEINKCMPLAFNGVNSVQFNSVCVETIDFIFPCSSGGTSEAVCDVQRGARTVTITEPSRYATIHDN